MLKKYINNFKNVNPKAKGIICDTVYVSVGQPYHANKRQILLVVIKRGYKCPLDVVGTHFWPLIPWTIKDTGKNSMICMYCTGKIPLNAL